MSVCTEPRFPSATGMSARYRDQHQVYSIAHTARCKLQLAADRPDRNLRFILGHAFTLDKLRLRIAEIEDDSDSSDNEAPPNDNIEATRERRVSFHTHSPRGSQSVERKRSPPPEQFSNLEDTDSDDDEGVDEEEEEENGLSLQRFESATAKPPRMVDDDSSSSSGDEDEPKSPPPLSEEELKTITGGSGDEELAGLYEHVAGCPCHGESAPAISQVWEIPHKVGHEGPRRALIQVAA